MISNYHSSDVCMNFNLSNKHFLVQQWKTLEPTSGVRFVSKDNAVPCMLSLQYLQAVSHAF